MKANYFVHPQALVETDKIGEGSRIWAFAHILPGAVVGKNANICDHTYVENHVKLGNNVTVKCGVYLWDGLEVEDDVCVGPAATFTNDKFPRSKNTDYKLEKTVLKKGCSIGANATIIAGITIGSYALVGAGAVVTKNVPDFGLVYGNPARLQGYICVCTRKINHVGTETKVVCTCNRSYTWEDDILIPAER